MMLNEPVRSEEVMQCLLCGGDGQRVPHMSPERTDSRSPSNLRRCSSCELVWLDPRPVSEDVGKLYVSYATHSPRGNPSWLARVHGTIRDAIIRGAFGYGSSPRCAGHGLAGWWLGLIWPLREMAWVSLMCLDGRRTGRLLDVGCGDGRFLAMMRGLGWEPFGIEPDAQAAEVARSSFRVNVTCGTLQQSSFQSEFFDAITLNHVIEHAHDPLQLLRECRRLLRADGKLVLVTPNIESLGFRLFKRSWQPLHLPWHLYLFTLTSMRRILERADFSVNTLRTTARAAQWVWVPSRLGPFHHTTVSNVPWHIWLEGLVFQLVEECLRLLWRRAGEELLVIAKKSSASHAVRSATT